MGVKTGCIVKKLNWQIVAEIRAAAKVKEPRASIAKRFGISQSMVSLVVNRKVWTLGNLGHVMRQERKANRI